MPAQTTAPSAARGALAPYVVSTALGSTAYIASFAVATLAAREITGDAQLAGLPSALGTIGTATAIGLLSALMARRGRRPGLLAGYLAAIAGAVTSLVAVAVASFPLLLAGSIAIGFGNAALQLSRYAAADLVAPERRASVVGTVIWGSTAGAILGPNLLQPAGSLAAVAGRPALEGGMAVTVLGFLLTLLVTLRWVRTASTAVGAREAVVAAGQGATTPPSGIAEPVAVPEAPVPARNGRLGLLAPVRVRVALIGLVAGQVVMVLIMAMTPVHVHDMGEPLATVGFVISAHTLGMFALSPVSGRLVGRFGALPVMVAGFGVLLLSAVLAAVARQPDIPLLALALFLLGYGWNLGFVAGSSLLTSGASLAERIRLQGVTDVLVWSAGAAAGLSSGFLMDWAGYPMLATVGGVLLAIPVIAILLARRRMPAAAGAALTADG
ncbi:MAG: MFS transporter [Chloroflexota bacterium]